MSGITRDSVAANFATTDTQTSLLQSILGELYIANTYLAAIAAGQTINENPATLRADADQNGVAATPVPIS